MFGKFNTLLYERVDQGLLPQMARIARTQPRVETRMRATVEAGPRPLRVSSKYRSPQSYNVPPPHGGIGLSSVLNAERPRISEKLAALRKGERRELLSHDKETAFGNRPGRVARAGDLEVEQQLR